MLLFTEPHVLHTATSTRQESFILFSLLPKEITQLSAYTVVLRYGTKFREYVSSHKEIQFKKMSSLK